MQTTWRKYNLVHYEPFLVGETEIPGLVAIANFKEVIVGKLLFFLLVFDRIFSLFRKRKPLSPGWENIMRGLSKGE